MVTAPNPGDCDVICTINGFDVTAQLRQLVVFEDIKKPYVVIQGLVADNADLINRVPIKTNATLQATFYQSPDQTPQYSSTWILSIVKVHRPSDSLRSTYFSFQGYSPHMFSLPRIQKSYGEIPMTGVVADLINQLPGKIKSLIVRAPAKNMAGNMNMPYLVKNRQIWDAVKKAMQGSASSTDLSSVYLLFENRTNLVLDTLEHLIQSPMPNGSQIGSYYEKRLGGNFLGDTQSQQNMIISYHKDDMLDTTALIQAGSQDTAYFDLFGQGFQALLTSFGGGGGGGKASGISQLVLNNFRPPNFAKDIAAPRKTMAAQADSQSVTAQVAMNPALTVGSAVTLNFVGAIGDVQQTPIDDWQSGNFLIQETRHDVIMSYGRMQGSTTVRGVPQSISLG